MNSMGQGIGPENNLETRAQIIVPRKFFSLLRGFLEIIMRMHCVRFMIGGIIHI